MTKQMRVWMVDPFEEDAGAAEKLPSHGVAWSTLEYNAEGSSR